MLYLVFIMRIGSLLRDETYSYIPFFHPARGIEFSASDSTASHALIFSTITFLSMVKRGVDTLLANRISANMRRRHQPFLGCELDLDALG